MTFRRRFLILFSLISLVPIAMVQVYTFVFYVPSISGKIKALIDYNLEQKGENLRLLLRADVEIIYQIAGDPGIADSIRSLSDAEPGLLALQESRLTAAFSQLALFHSSLAGIGYLGEDGRLVGYDKYLMIRDAEGFDRFFRLDRIRKAVDEGGGLQFFPTTEFRDRADLPKNLLVAAFPYVDVVRQEKRGYLILLLHEASLKDVLNPSPSDKTGILTRSYLFDAQGEVLSAPDDGAFRRGSAPPAERAPSLQTLAAALPELKGRALNTTTRPGPFDGWTLATVYDESSVFADRNLIAIYTLLMGVFFFLFSGAVSYWVYRNMFRSFTRLMEGVRVEDARLGHHPGAPTNEFAILGAAWSGMQERIAGLVQEVNARNASLLSLSEERRLAEIRSLEAQVNPHFLYNTLNTLNWVAIDNKQPVLSQALSDLAEIMRYSISQIDVAATLRDELQWLGRYLSLQSLRFGKNLEYRVEAAGVDDTFRLYKMLFQPFVENALIHAFDLNRPGCQLEVSFSLLEDRRLKTVIRDNGKGFDPALVQERVQRSSIGISNVERRLRSYYGDAAILRYDSAPGQGTRVELVVPEVGVMP